MMHKILSIDGGGIKGAYPAACLAALENDLPQPIGKYFDLIVGTSTGGIIALALGAGLSGAQVADFYRTYGPRIFGGGRITRLLRRVMVAKYNNAELRNALEVAFGTKILANSQTRLVIPSASVETGRIHLYKTRHHARLTTDYNCRMVDVGLATAAAPTYFPVGRAASGLPLVDGGLFANNPVGIAAVEAVSMLGWAKGQFSILSIGCTEERPDLSHAVQKLGGGGIYWLSRAIGFMMSTQSSLAIGTAQHLAGHDSVFRVNETVASGRFKLDDVSRLPELLGLGAESAREWKPKLREVFFSQPAEPFVATAASRP